MDEEIKIYHPKLLAKDYALTVETVKMYVKKGLRPAQACARCGIASTTYATWKKHAKQEIDAGYTDTPCINFVTAIEEADAELEEDISKKAIELAKEGNTDLLKFILKSRIGWGSKKEVEVSTPEDKSIKFEIVGMTDIHGSSENRDDSEPNKMDKQ